MSAVAATGAARGIGGRALDGLRHVKHGSIRGLRRLVDGVVFAGARARHGPGRVIAGPFAGMRFGVGYPFGTPRAIALGTYEKELHPVLERVGRLPFGRFVDVGGADGCYAVGAALFWRVGRVTVFEALEAGRAAIVGHARLNGVADRIDVRGLCREEDLLALFAPDRRDLLIMDVEGAEEQLLSERVVAGLAGSVVIVEAHDFARPGIARGVAARFAGSHDVAVVASAPRTERDWPVPDRAPRRAKLALMDERRPCGMEWVVCFPRGR